MKGEGTNRIRNGQYVLREEAEVMIWYMVVQATINWGQEQSKMRKQEERMGVNI